MPVTSTLLSVVRVDPYTTIGTLIALFSSYLFYKAYLLPNFLSPLRHIPGPPNESKYNKYRLPFLGNYLDILAEEAGVPHRRWIEQYGSIICYRGLLNNQRVLIADPKAIQHVFSTHSYRYTKPSRVRRLLSEVTGNGVLVAEGDVHKKQRKMLNPAFGHKHIKEMVPIMAIPAAKLGRLWEERVDQSDNKSVEFDITTDLSNATLDIIGIAGNSAYRELFGSSSIIIQLFRLFIPAYMNIPFAHNRRRWHSVQAIERVSSRLIAEKRAQANAETPVGPDEKEGKDLMSILIRGNEQVGSLEDGKLTDRELKDQILTFLAAGHETTSVTVTWMLHIFSIYPDVQKRVRNELLSALGRPSDDKMLSYDELNALPYLNACVKELLRFIPPVPTTTRVASQDDTILGYDIPKGTQIFLSPAVLHKLKSVFGEDADEFKPERWMDPATVPEEIKAKTKFVTPDMSWAYSPFLSGPRNCIGSKFALIETKILVYYLLANLEYHPAPGFTFKKVSRVTWRPTPGMRLIVKRLDTSEETKTSAI
ncbi:hypothetical protein BGZ51_001100 [Haplosporangium sp. Z 767]|nr:hypothetical protein BGZ51_001100 [Haplosporangium sp. Z 767]